jgi:NAD(P)H-hydrate epimerase
MMATASKAATVVDAKTIDETLATSLLPSRELNAHKWSVGGVIVVGGSPGYVGAPAMAALSANRSGAGVVAVACPRGSIAAIAAIVPEATFISLPEGDVSRQTAEKFRVRFDKVRALVVGPGLGDDEYADSVMQILYGAKESPVYSPFGFSAKVSKPAPATSAEESALGREKPAVIDADGLNWLAKTDEWWSLLVPRTVVLTPHAGEMARLTGLETSEITSDPIGIAQRFAEKWQQTVVLKGEPTVVSNGEVTRVAASIEPALATAGSGDVLAGSIGAFLAQGLDPIDAATLAIYTGTAAARTLTDTLGTLGVIATDLPLAIAGELARLEQSKGGKRA